MVLNPSSVVYIRVTPCYGSKSIIDTLKNIYPCHVSITILNATKYVIFTPVMVLKPSSVVSARSFPCNQNSYSAKLSRIYAKFPYCISLTKNKLAKKVFVILNYFIKFPLKEQCHEILHLYTFERAKTVSRTFSLSRRYSITKF